jgi:hypothetical protein
MVETCSIHRRNEKQIQHFRLKTQKKKRQHLKSKVEMDF